MYSYLYCIAYYKVDNSKKETENKNLSNKKIDIMMDDSNISIDESCITASLGNISITDSSSFSSPHTDNEDLSRRSSSSEIEFANSDKIKFAAAADDDDDDITFIKYIKNDDDDNDIEVESTTNEVQSVLTYHSTQDSNIYGCDWKNNSCALDSFSFALANIFKNSNEKQRKDLSLQLSDSNLGNLFKDIGENNLSQRVWSKHTENLRNIAFTGENKVKKGSLEVSISDVHYKLFFKSDKSSTHSTCINTHLECKSGHTSNIDIHIMNFGIRTPSIRSSLTKVIMNRIEEYVKGATQKSLNCQTKDCKHKGIIVSKVLKLPRLVFVFFDKVSMYPHKLQIIDKIIVIEKTTLNLRSIIYYKDKHFMTQSIQGNQLLQYDGMVKNGKVISYLIDESITYPYKIIVGAKTWVASSLIYESVL